MALVSSTLLNVLLVKTMCTHSYSASLLVQSRLHGNEVTSEKQHIQEN